ncbi:HPr family phosphocarrier protein [Pseudoflavonifractor sp. MSJ-37]|uniref:HPr family phosphocarrier protein n=1 Tax=Pseudoflavonifractor sp. MSJ-37 TaxID=2841531 RepID=UPI001C112D83|nr:HPr family phosphocarrier protein [Pseudoflavonifractor sp. MSJ-37]MBU5435197.1 HPr family phosphocarrier protein [Pseudoflavonifractor sp. MSJ-37]
MVSAKTRIVDPMGMHMRPAQRFVQTVMPFACDVTVLANGREVDGRSIMDLMSACLKQGMEIEIRCEGRREAECLQAAVALVESGMDR